MSRRASPSSAPRSSRRASSTPPRARARPATCWPPGRVDLVMVYAATYATSAQVLPAVQAAKAPVVILNLQPARSLDYEAMTTGEWLANCSACCVPELAGAFTRARVPYHTVTGTLLAGDPRLGQPARLDRGRRRGARRPAGALRLPRPQLPGHARHVLRLHADPGAGRLARRDPRDRRSRGPRRGRAGSRDRAARATRSARPSSSPSRAPTRSPARSSRSASSGRRASQSGSTRSCATSRSTG